MIDNLITRLEDFIEKKIAAERDIIDDGYVSRGTEINLYISRNDLRAALEARELEIRIKNDD